MIVGTIGYDCHSGLGHLVRSFYQAGVVNRVLVIPHPTYKNHPDWYEGHRYTTRQVNAFLSGMDVLLLFENAFKWDIAREAKKRGTKIVLMPNYEYTPFPPPVEPDLVWCPSFLDRDYYEADYPCLVMFCPVEVQWKLRERARVFVHNAGHGQQGYAKGTPEVLAAMKYVKSPIQMIVRGQPDDEKIEELLSKEYDDPRVKIVKEEVSDEELWSEGDVFVAPEQFNGMSLMLQEARAAGLLVMTTDRYPTNQWLPQEPMIPVKKYVDYSICVNFQRAVVNPEDIAATIDAWYDRDISQYSREGREWGYRCSWDNLRRWFMDMLNGVVQLGRSSGNRRVLRTASV